VCVKEERRRRKEDRVEMSPSVSLSLSLSVSMSLFRVSLCLSLARAQAWRQREEDGWGAGEQDLDQGPSAGHVCAQPLPSDPPVAAVCGGGSCRTRECCQRWQPGNTFQQSRRRPRARRVRAARRRAPSCTASVPLSRRLLRRDCDIAPCTVDRHSV
jgi:hypothetical protein